MLDKSAPTIISPAIPRGDVTPLENLLLSLIFEAREEGDTLRFFTRHGPSHIVTLSRADLAAALAASAEATDSVANRYVAERIGRAGAQNASDPFDDFDLDMTGTSWEFLFQDIVRRSSTIDEIVVRSATISDGSDGFDLDGSVTMITAATVRSKSTTDGLEELRTGARSFSEDAFDAAMCLWAAALDMRRDADASMPMQRTIHRMLDVWAQVGNRRMRSWMMAIADDAVAVSQVLAGEHNAKLWSFEHDIAPAVLEAFSWSHEGPFNDGCDADFIANVHDGIRRRFPDDTEVF